MEMQFKELKKNYGQKQALKGVNLTLTPGIYGLLGPNGAGKSTMMNILTGNLKQTSGEILFDGKDVRTLGAEFRRRIGYCPQQQAFYPGFTAEQFLFYMASLHSMTKQEAARRIEWALKLLTLYDVRSKAIRSFSGGMKQRLLIAQSIIHDPDILILDEPTAGLDPRQRITVRNLIGEISLHKIVLISTHVVQDVEYIAKEMILLSEGEVLCQSTPRELLKGLENRVWEIRAGEDSLAQVQQHGIICGIAKEDDGVCVRLLSESRPPIPCEKARPTLEDVYLHYFGAEEEL